MYENVHLVAFSALASLVLVGGILVVTLRNLFRAALCLGLVFVGIAGLFLLLKAEFIAFVQILVYVGAVLTLIVFAIMLSPRAELNAGPKPAQAVVSGILCIVLFGLLAGMALAAPLPEAIAQAAPSTGAVGQQLVTTLVLPFEVVSLVLIAAMVGAVVLAAKGSSRSGN